MNGKSLGRMNNFFEMPKRLPSGVTGRTMREEAKDAPGGRAPRPEDVCGVGAQDLFPCVCRDFSDSLIKRMADE